MKLRAGDEVIAVEIARDDQDLLVVTENGFGKRTRVDEYPTKGRGTMGVLTIRYNESRGRLAGAMIVRDGYEVMLISPRRHRHPHGRRGHLADGPRDAGRAAHEPARRATRVSSHRPRHRAAGAATPMPSGDEPSRGRGRRVDGRGPSRTADPAGDGDRVDRRSIVPPSRSSDMEGIGSSTWNKSVDRHPDAPASPGREVDRHATGRSSRTGRRSTTLPQLELYLGQVCAVAGITKMQLDYWTTKADIPTEGQQAARLRHAGGRAGDADQAGQGQGPEPGRCDRRGAGVPGARTASATPRPL